MAAPRPQSNCVRHCSPVPSLTVLKLPMSSFFIVTTLHPRVRSHICAVSTS